MFWSKKDFVSLVIKQNTLKVQSFLRASCSTLEDLLEFPLLFEFIIVFSYRKKRNIFLLPTSKYFWTSYAIWSCPSVVGKPNPLVIVYRILGMMFRCHQPGTWDLVSQMTLRALLSRFLSTSAEENLLHDVEHGLWMRQNLSLHLGSATWQVTDFSDPLGPLHCSV